MSITDVFQENNIAYDVRTFDLPGGSRVYGQNLLQYFPPERTHLFGIHNYKNFPHCYPTKIKPTSILRLLYENFTLPYQVQKNNISLFHGLKGVAPLFGNFKKVITVHDIIAFKYPESMRFKDVVFWKYFFPIYLRNADQIICISEYTKKDIMKRFNISEEKISVVYHGFEPKEFHIISRNDALSTLSTLFQAKHVDYLKNKQYLLNVNTISPRKNISKLIKAFEMAKKKNSSLHLLIVGKLGWKYNETLEIFEKSPYKQDITFLDYVSDKELNALYNISFAFIYPSLYEGFGLPILEAQSCMTPVITSNSSCLPEIAGESALFVDPNDIESIANAIINLSLDIKLQKELQKKGLNNIKRFSWEKCAKETVKVYKKTLLI